MYSSGQDSVAGQSLLERCKEFLTPRARTLGLTIPLHLVAFLALYIGTVRLLEREVVLAASETSAQQLNLVTRELFAMAEAHAFPEGPRGHAFDALFAGHRSKGLRLFLPDGSVLGKEEAITSSESEAMREFLAAGEEQRAWLSREGGEKRIRGLMKVIATGQCIRCHQGGSTLAIVSMKVELTQLLDRISSHSRKSLALLIIAWAFILGVISWVVKRSIQRSTDRLEAELEAAEAGTIPPASDAPELVLDPATAQLQRSLRSFLARQTERRAEITSRLVHADQLATAGELAAGLAHEIKNPLAGIQGALEILRDDTTDSSTRRLHEQMLDELKRVHETLATLLSSARPSPPRLADTQIDEMLEDVRRLLAPGLGKRRITLEVEMPADPLVARVDPAKIRQVLVNLVKNAGEAIEKDGRIVLRAGRFPDAEQGIILSVEDNGPGIGPDEQEKIFETFFTTKFSGTGLGLSIAAGLVEQHGGSIEVESEPGKGTTFFLILPSHQQSSLEAVT